MRHEFRKCLTLAVAVLACSILVPAVEAQSLLGEWRLVEQTYGAGASNLVDTESAPLRLEFVQQGVEIVGRMRAGDSRAPAFSWPRLVADEARAVRIEEKRVAATLDDVLVRYRVDPAPGDDLVLEVTEQYRVIEEGRALAGSVEVRFERGGRDRGSYTLQRRFEREP